MATLHRLALTAALAATLPWPAPASAAEADGSVAALFDGLAVAGNALEDLRGGSELTSLDVITNNGRVADNVAHDLTTGNNIITDGSLASNAGFATVIQNSGNNVLIQNSTIINLDIR